MKIGFLMKSPFYLGGEQRVVSVIASALAEKGNDVCIMYTAFDAMADKEKYNLSEKVKLCQLKGMLNKFNIKRVFYKIIKKMNEKTNLLINHENLLEKIYYKRDKKLINNICNVINENEFDIVIGSAGYYSMLLAILKDRLNCKVYGWQHNCYEGYFKTKEQYFWHQDSIFKKNLKNLDKYIVLTNYDKGNMERNFDIKCEVISNPRSFSSDVKSTLQNKKFLALGRLEDAKGYDLLLESFKIFAQKNKEWNLDIVGDGSKKDSILKKINEYNLQDRITLYPATKDVKKYMLDSSIFLFPSRWEGFGLVILEAFEIGLPVIAYELNPVKEIINDNKDGFLIKKFDTRMYAECMLNLANNYEKLKKMSNNAIIKSEKYSIETIIKKWEEIL